MELGALGDTSSEKAYEENMSVKKMEDIFSESRKQKGRWIGALDDNNIL